MNRQFEVHVSAPRPNGKPVRVKYPKCDGYKALANMKTLAARGCIVLAITEANDVEDALDLDEMEQLYGNGEWFTLEQQPAARPKPATFENNDPRTQRVLLTGLDCLAGQGNLFDTDGA